MSNTIKSLLYIAALCIALLSTQALYKTMLAQQTQNRVASWPRQVSTPADILQIPVTENVPRAMQNIEVKQRQGAPRALVCPPRAAATLVGGLTGATDYQSCYVAPSVEAQVPDEPR